LTVHKIDFEIKDLNLYNVLASIAVLKELKIDLQKVKHKLKHLESSEGRGKKYLISRYKKKFKLIDESYNANPFQLKMQSISLV
jgi:UDP-N-acetylmuramyl pentapeptide synthase